MSNVKTKDVPFCERYVNLVLDGDILRGPMIANLKCLYEFIGKNSPGNPKYELGNGCRAILQKARSLAGCRAHIISKRQVIALIDAQCAGKTNDIVEYIKIPYTNDYIFRTIFDILDGYKNNTSVSIPDEISRLYGKIRRDVFYGEQSKQYQRKYNGGLLRDRPELSDLRRNLLNDLCSEECALGRKV